MSNLPPGFSRSSAQSSSQSSQLPPRPPPPSAGYNDPTLFRPRTVASAAPSWQPPSHSPAIAAGPAPPPAYDSSQYQQQYSQQHDGYDSNSYYNQPTAPAPPPSSNPNFDPQQEAAIAQWQSAYATQDEAAAIKAQNQKHVFSAPTSSGISNAEVSGFSTGDSGVASVVKSQDGSKSTVIRSGGGKTWQDPTLLEWDPTHFRLFVGNLAGEVTDDSLYKAFAKFPSIQKARVIRDKRTTKSKGFGFVSFSDGDEYFQAAREMNGKYIGSHPIILRKSTTEIKASGAKASGAANQNRKKGNQNIETHNNNHNSGSGAAVSAATVDHTASTGAKTGAGVHKKSHKSKNKGGYKILG